MSGIMIKGKKKSAIIKKSGRHEKDTGSSDVQVAVLNERIKLLTAHLKENKKDNSSRRGLLKLVARRRAHEKFLAKKAKK